MSRRTARLWKGIAILLLPLMLTTAAATAPVFQSTLIFADGSEPIGLYPPPGIGVVRHADAGYVEAGDAARRHGIVRPM